MSLAACIPSSFRFFSICLLRAREARSSALMAQPMMTAWRGPRATLLVADAHVPGGGCRVRWPGILCTPVDGVGRYSGGVVALLSTTSA